jgi:hypothetical protein
MHVSIIQLCGHEMFLKCNLNLWTKEYISSDKLLDWWFCMTTGNTVELVHVASHDYMLQEFYVKQLLRFNLICRCRKWFIDTVFSLFICKKEMWRKISSNLSHHLERTVSSDETWSLPMWPRKNLPKSPKKSWVSKIKWSMNIELSI